MHGIGSSRTRTLCVKEPYRLDLMVDHISDGNTGLLTELYIPSLGVGCEEPSNSWCLERQPSSVTASAQLAHNQSYWRSYRARSCEPRSNGHVQNERTRPFMVQG